MKIRIDPLLRIMTITIILASIFPAEGIYKSLLSVLATFSVGFLFFTYGAKLSREAVIAGIKNWPLHLIILSSTYIIFPLLGLSLNLLPFAFLPNEIYMGFIFLCILPSTVQSSIAFTSIARGNIAAAICSASLSSVLGVFLTPVLLSILLHSQGNFNIVESIIAIFLKILLPFIGGHLCRPILISFIIKYNTALKKVDLGSILLIVYMAFSNAMIEGIWHKIDLSLLLIITLISSLILILILSYNKYIAQLFHFSKENEIAMVFCGSKKSLVNGLPMANVLFPPSILGIVVIPLIIFHQIQLIFCSVLAERYNNQKENHET